MNKIKIDIGNLNVGDLIVWRERRHVGYAIKKDKVFLTIKWNVDGIIHISKYPFNEDVYDFNREYEIIRTKKDEI